MDLGHIAGGATLGRPAVGDHAVGGIAPDARLVPLRLAMGIRADDKSLARLAPAVFIRLGGLSLLVEGFAKGCRPRPAAAAKRCVGDCNSVLCALDDSKLRRLSSPGPAAFEFSARTLYRQQ